MSFLLNNESENIAARITNKGRQKVAEGNFNIKYFQVGDSEYDYNFSNFNGTGVNNPAQKVFAPLDKDSTVKYPYKLSESTVTGTTFGIPIRNSEVVTVKNNMGAAGFTSEYVQYDGDDGVTVVCDSVEIDITNLNGLNILRVPNSVTFDSCEFITLAFTRLVGTNATISGSSNSLIYKVVNITLGTPDNLIELDRNMPDLRSLSGYVTVICNKCNPFFPNGYNSTYNCLPLEQDPTSQQDPWKLNIVWSKKPAGMDVLALDKSLTGYSSNVFVSTKEYLGYNISDGQLYNTGTTITNSFGEEILVLPEEQHSLAILHYSEQNNTYEPEKYFKYEDYIGNVETEDIEHFEVHIPFLLYHRNTGTTIGARFFMDTTDYYVDSSAFDTKLYRIKYRYLIDEQNIRVGKVFVDKKIIVFDDQEIVATLDYKSNRKYTLPVPRVTTVPTDVNYNLNDYSLMDGTSGQTVYLSYLFQYVSPGEERLNGLHCNHYSKITGTTLPSDVSLKFSENEFRFMKTTFSELINGFIANRFKVIVQVVEEGEELEAENWRVINYTGRIPNHSYGDIISPVNLRDVRFVVSYADYDSATIYNVEDFLGLLPDPYTTLPYFGDEQPFPGSIKLTRSTDFQMLKFLVNLPESEFMVTQNPTWETGDDLRVTELALLDDNKDVLVIAKTPSPIKRIGTQVFAIKLDF